MALVVTLPGNLPCKVIECKVTKASRITPATILALYTTTDSNNVKKLKCNHVGTVTEVVVNGGQVIQPGDPVIRLERCRHPTVMKDMCADCGADLREEHGVAGDRKDPTSATVAMIHSIPELIVSEEQALEIGRRDETRLLANRKLVLLVDLDQTLLHTTNDNIPANLKDVEHFRLWHGRWTWYHTMFRPGTRQFLDRVSQLYELHICTFGVRMYAHTIAGILDPEGKYFSHRILSRDECFSSNSKTANLKALFPCGDFMVCIIDDRDDVWKFAPNLIQVKPYLFFDGTADINAPPGMATKTRDGSVKAPRHNVKVIRVPKQKQVDQSGGDTKENTSKDANLGTKEISKIEAIDETEYVQEKKDDPIMSNCDTDNGEHVVQDGDSVAAKKNDIPVDESTHVPMDVSNGNPQDSQNSEPEAKEVPASLSLSESVNIPASKELIDSDEAQSAETTATDRVGVENKKSNLPEQPQNEPVLLDQTNVSPSQTDNVSTDNNSCVPSDLQTCDKVAGVKSDIPVDSDKEFDVGTTESLKQQESSTVLEVFTKTSDSSQPEECSMNLGDLEVSSSDSSSSDSENSQETNKCAQSLEPTTNISESVDSQDQPASRVQKDSKLESDDAVPSQESVTVGKSDKEEGEVTSEDGEGGDSQKVNATVEPGQDFDEFVVWEDTDDYLIYLEDILRRSHQAYYEMYDQGKKNSSQEKIPDLKSIIPYVKKKVLKGANILFSGVIPTNQVAEKSRAYRTALSLGANIQTVFVPRTADNKDEATTHLVAAKKGTAKVHQVRKHKKVKVVNPDWLWTCAERWEWVDERIFPLSDQSSYPYVDSPEPGKPAKIKPPVKNDSSTSDNKEHPNTAEPAKVKDRKFSETYNPLFAFSSTDIKEMDKEVDEEIFEESESEDSEAELRRVVLGFGQKRPRESSSEESLAPEFPKGWGKKRKKRSGDNVAEPDRTDDDLDDENEDRRKIIENPGQLMKFSESSESRSSFVSGESVEDELAAALEKEFLSY